MTINERIKYLRKNIFCLSQAELAEKLGISQTAVAVLEQFKDKLISFLDVLS